VEFDVVEYLTSPLSREDLDRVLALIEDAPEQLVRKDKRWKELGLDPANYQTPARVAELLVDHPELMQRPVVINGDRGIIARPPEKLLELLD
jgi:arsenate reductase